jgi:hypothetical protein
VTDQKRLADALRLAGFFHLRSDAGKMYMISDEEVLEETEGTIFRARVELGLAMEDFRNEFLTVYERWAVEVLDAILWFINWFKRGKENDDGR